MDIDDGQLQKANENIVFAELGSRVHLLKASSMGRKPAEISNDLKQKLFCFLFIETWSALTTVCMCNTVNVFLFLL